jgi:hypothetical protein
MKLVIVNGTVPEQHIEVSEVAPQELVLDIKDVARLATALTLALAGQTLDEAMADIAGVYI